MDGLTRQKIDRRCREDAAIRRARERNPERLKPGEWYWLRMGWYARGADLDRTAVSLIDRVDRQAGRRPRYHPAIVLEIRGDAVAMGIADIGRVELVRASSGRIARMLDQRETRSRLWEEPRLLLRQWSGVEIPWDDPGLRSE